MVDWIPFRNGDLTTWTSVFILDTVIIQMLGTQGWTWQSLCPHILVVAQKEAWFGCCCRHVRKLRDFSKVIPQFAEFKQQQEKLHQGKRLACLSAHSFWFHILSLFSPTGHHSYLKTACTSLCFFCSWGQRATDTSIDSSPYNTLNMLSLKIEGAKTKRGWFL